MEEESLDKMQLEEESESKIKKFNFLNKLKNKSDSDSPLFTKEKTLLAIKKATPLLLGLLIVFAVVAIAFLIGYFI